MEVIPCFVYKFISFVFERRKRSVYVSRAAYTYIHMSLDGVSGWKSQWGIINYWVFKLISVITLRKKSRS